MSADRFFLTLIVAGGVATGAIFVGTDLGKAADTKHIAHAQHMRGPKAVKPTMPGQGVFGTIQEIVHILEADPATNWSKANIAALREHLIDMDGVTMRCVTNQQALADGIAITVTGEGRTLARQSGRSSGQLLDADQRDPNSTLQTA